MSAESIYRASIVGLETLIIQASEFLINGHAKRLTLADTGAAYIEAASKIKAYREASQLITSEWERLTEAAPAQSEPANPKDESRANSGDSDSESDDDGSAGTDDGSDEPN